MEDTIEIVREVGNILAVVCCIVLSMITFVLIVIIPAGNESAC